VKGSSNYNRFHGWNAWIVELKDFSKFRFHRA
jgi:hypothetical protein